MSANLDSILAATRHRVAEAKSHTDLGTLEKLAAKHVPRPFRAKLKAIAEHDFAVIAELKKASPSRGLIRANFDPQVLATELQSAGAAALSVLTDEEFFQGSLSNLEIAAASSRLPCLRKDFIVDEFQVLESRAHDADAILLIVAALNDSELRSLYATAREFELDALCEVHDELELARALEIGFDMIGVNSRDLRSFQINLDTPLRLAERLPSSVLGIAESGIHCGADIRKLRAAGYDAFLIGESLMKSAEPGRALQSLLDEARAARFR